MSRRVLLVGEYGTLNGGENSFLASAPGLSLLDWDFVAAVPTPSEFASALRAKEIQTIDLNLIGKDGVRKSQLEIREILQQILVTIRPELVHCNSLASTRLMAPVTERTGTRCLGYLRDIIRLSKTAISDINCADALVAVSNATRSWHVGQGISAEKAKVIYNGIAARSAPANEADDHLKTNIRRELNLPASAPLILSVGQIGMRKGLEVLLLAFEVIVSRLPDARLIIAGTRNSVKDEAIEYERQLHEKSHQIESASGSQCIHWLGRRSDIDSLMRHADLLVHTARQEPLGRVLLEAGANGLPFIATDVGGTPEILDDQLLRHCGETSIRLSDCLMPKNDSRWIAEAAIELLSDDAARRELSKILPIVIAEKFSVEAHVRAVNHLYSQLLIDS